MQTVFNKRIDPYEQGNPISELQVLSIVRNTARKYFKKNYSY